MALTAVKGVLTFTHSDGSTVEMVLDFEGMVEVNTQSDYQTPSWNDLPTYYSYGIAKPYVPFAQSFNLGILMSHPKNALQPYVRVTKHQPVPELDPNEA